MRIAIMHYPLKTLGPGKRVGIWTTGCKKRCKNCMSPELQKFDESKNYKIDKIINDIQEVTNGLTKEITISGGEPFENEDFYNFLLALKSNGFEDILVFTGKSRKEIESNEKYKKCLECIDVLVAGEYIDSLNEDTILKGSSNQEIIIYNKKLSLKYDEYLKGKREIEIVMTDEKVLVFGIPKKNTSKKLRLN